LFLINYGNNDERKGENVNMVVELNHLERDFLINQLEVMILPELRCQIGSGVRKELRDELKKEKAALVEILQKLKSAA
jgi:hypothetical protein